MGDWQSKIGRQGTCVGGIMSQVGVGVDVFSEGDKCQLSKFGEED